MYKICTITLIIVYIILLMFAFSLLINGYICDGHTCRPMIEAKTKTTTKKEMIYLLDKLCEDGLWPFAYIASTILSCLILCIFPMVLDISIYTVIFLVSFLVFYCIIGFFVHHYVVPIKKYIMAYINNMDEE